MLVIYLPTSWVAIRLFKDVANAVLTLREIKGTRRVVTNGSFLPVMNNDEIGHMKPWS